MSAPLWDRDRSHSPKPISQNRRGAMLDADRIAARRVLWGVWVIGLGVAFLLTRGLRSSTPSQQDPAEARDLAPIGTAGGESSGYGAPDLPHRGGRGGPPRRPAL